MIEPNIYDETLFYNIQEVFLQKKLHRGSLTGLLNTARSYYCIAT